VPRRPLPRPLARLLPCPSAGLPPGFTNRRAYFDHWFSLLQIKSCDRPMHPEHRCTHGAGSKGSYSKRVYTTHVCGDPYQHTRLSDDKTLGKHPEHQLHPALSASPSTSLPPTSHHNNVCAFTTTSFLVHTTCHHTQMSSSRARTWSPSTDQNTFHACPEGALRAGVCRTDTAKYLCWFCL